MSKPKPKYLLRKVFADNKIRKYRGNKYNVLSALIGRPETRSVFFSYEKIEELWGEIQYHKVEKGIPVSGVRVYLSCYEEAVPADVPYANQLGLIFVLTKTEADKNRDFFIEDVPGFNERPEPVRDRDRGLDHGIPCPPDCDAGEFWP